MRTSTSKLETGRQDGKHQVDEQRTAILDAAEKLFLQNGLEATKMVDIAAQAGITKITLYRYFPNRDVIAVEIHVRMLAKISPLVEPVDCFMSLEGARKTAQAMIRNFDTLRDAYRFAGMFDKLYLDNPHDAPLPRWTIDRLIPLLGHDADLERVHELPQGNRIVMVMNTVIWFLEKLALRGELTWSDQSVPLEEHLKLFEEMILGYLDRLEE